MFEQIAYFLIFGKPLIMYLGIITLISFIFTALIAVLNRKGIHVIHLKWHSRMAWISIALGIIHGILGLSRFF